MDISAVLSSVYKCTLSIDCVLNTLNISITHLDTNKKTILTTRDTIAQLPLFHEYSRFESKDFDEYTKVILRTYLLDDTKNEDIATYVFTIYKNLPVIKVSTMFDIKSSLTDNSSDQWIHNPFKKDSEVSWMHISLSNQNYFSFHGFGPEMKGDISELVRPVSFSDGFALKGDTGSIGFFNCGKVLYHPVMNQVWTDCEFKSLPPVWYDMQLSETLVFGEPDTDLSELKSIIDHKNIETITSNPEVTAKEIKMYPLLEAYTGINICEQKHSVFLTDICKKAFPISFRKSPLFTLAGRRISDDKTFYITSLDEWERVSVIPRDNYYEIRFYNPINGEIQNFSVCVIARFTSINSVEWSVDILNDNEDITVLSAGYPAIRFSGKNLDAFLPEFSGWTEHNITETNFHQSGFYPAGNGYTMPYFCIYNTETDKNNGFYYAVHDRNGALKKFTLDCSRENCDGVLTAEFPAINIGNGANAFSLGGTMVWNVFSGDWFDATQIYKKFVKEHAAWLPEVSDNGRENMPEWMKKVPFWIMDWMPNTNPAADPLPTSIRPKKDAIDQDIWFKVPIKLQEALGVPMGYHLYNWHWIPFNNDYPHYFPVKEGFEEGVKKLEEHSVHVMPYINARLWDTLDKGGEDYLFDSQARKWAVKDDNDKLHLESYESHEPNGKLCELAAMCPSSHLWKTKIAQIIDRLFTEYKVSGVYLDQIGAVHPDLCMDKGHNHLPGGGDWWIKEYNLLIERACLAKPENGVFTTEDNAEVYAKYLDGFLTWTWIKDNLVPAFPGVYSGYVAMLGRNTNGFKKEDTLYFKYHVAQQLLFGEQIGWINSDVVEYPDKLSFLKKMVSLRYACSPFFYRGEILRPPHVTSNIRNEVTFSGMSFTHAFDIKMTLAGAWKLWDETDSVLFIINLSDKENDFTLSVNKDEYNLNTNSDISIKSGDGTISDFKENGKLFDICGHLPPNEYIELHWR